ncbi:hypothetical protein L6452_21188 [Arctium lappa]|uniref:Uncharacterized protein n=1 Tax=Arctium lappa TaxID=4217 RepID=A0ACB9BDI5_ARCLA|nr:hypothetical protein L6452_21188 [Arctium lappa]
MAVRSYHIPFFSLYTIPSTPTPLEVKIKPNPPEQPEKKNNIPVIAIVATTATGQQVPKKQVLVVKHRKSHEIDRHPDQETRKSIDKKKTHNSSPIIDVSQPTTTTTTTVDVSNGEPEKTGGETPSRGRRYSGLKRSYDFDMEMGCKNDKEVVVVVDGDHHRGA